MYQFQCLITSFENCVGCSFLLFLQTATFIFCADALHAQLYAYRKNSC